MAFDIQSILKELDLAFLGNESSCFPTKLKNDIHYNFFLDLENGYNKLAKSKIHLYGDSVYWAIVFETNGYNTRQGRAIIELIYIGNNINYVKEVFPERTYVSNLKDIVLIESEEFKRIEQSDNVENYELIKKNIDSIQIRNSKVSFTNDPLILAKLKIPNRKNKENLIEFGSLVRMLNETNNDLMSAYESEITSQFVHQIPKIIEINKFHYHNKFENNLSPSEQELYQLIAQILVMKDASLWKPNEKPNNHWSNWTSGDL